MDKRIEEMFPYPKDGRKSKAVCNAKREAAQIVFEKHVQPMEFELQQIEALGELVFMRGKTPYEIAHKCVQRYSDMLVLLEEYERRLGISHGD